MSRVLSDPVPESVDGAPPQAGLDGQPPGERRFRHPGDVVRLALWGTATLVLAALIAVATSTSEGVTTDVGRVVTRLPGSVREFLLGLIQIAALAVPLAVVVGLVVTRRWHRLLMVALAGAAGAGLFALLGVEPQTQIERDALHGPLILHEQADHRVPAPGLGRLREVGDPVREPAAELIGHGRVGVGDRGASRECVQPLDAGLE